MRFLLYNIRYGTGIGRTLHLPWSRYLRRTGANLARIIEFIRSEKPDIAGLVEVDAGSYRSGHLNQAEIIARALGHYHCFESKYSAASLARRCPVVNKQVNAFLTGHAVRGARFHYFRTGMKRLVIELELDRLTLLLVHLSIKFRVRHHQLTDLHELVAAVKKPCIVAGDFNAFWGDREIKLFLAATGLRNASTRACPSFPSWRPRRQLDFVLCSPEIKVTSLRAPRVMFSDHLPLVCDFELPDWR